jgi:hypothetical protein
MASSGEAAWVKHFKGKGDISTTLNADSNLYDDVTGRSLSKTLKKGTEITFLGSTVYETPCRIKFKQNGKIVSARVPFNNVQKPLKGDKSVKAKLKPSDISPDIVDVWLTPQEIVSNVKKYLKTIALPEEDLDAMHMLLDLTVKDTLGSINVGKMDKNLVPSEFYEILTSIKLAVLMRSNDTKIRKVLGVPKKMDLSKAKIKIMIPKKANMPLLDYYISVSAGNSPEERIMKISVKSKVASSSTNTVKFNDAFKNSSEVNSWYKSVIDKKDQIGQKVIADSAVSAPKGKALIYPITALAELFDVRRDLIRKSMNTFKTPEKFNMKEFEGAIKTLARNMSKLNKKDNLDSVIKSHNQYNELKRFMQENLYQRGNSPITDFTVENGSFLCEKIIAKATSESLKGLNFYQMFYDQILVDKEIAYAVADKSGSSINYKYYSKINWAAEYHNWIELRSKNLINNLNDTLGMDV